MYTPARRGSKCIYGFQRIYFSAYQRGLGHPDIPGERISLSNPDSLFLREHRLYQVDFLIRKYGFSRNDIPLDASGNLRLDKYPKEIWAETHPEFYPVRINLADKEELLMVPGIGIKTVEIILKIRQQRKITNLKDLGIKGKRLDKVKKYVIFE